MSIQAKEKKRKETYHVCFDLYVHVWEVRVSESPISIINSDRTLKSPTIGDQKCQQ